ncbi:hypothetical protein ACQ4LE_008831 [Meloidogyne hapla]|uniref:Cytoplasmic tRNA 2-thiolation protein 1 n=1 Tax=Meloidogyne hapla TaxID=6305 RepID=A0A1I8BHM7_MELHA
MVNCQECTERQAKIKTSKDGHPRCVECFNQWFEEDVHKTILETKIFNSGERIGIGVSGGKDSTVLAEVLNKLNKKYSYGLELVLLCVDEGIEGYRDDSIKEVLKTEINLSLPLKIISYKQLYGWTMDEIVAKIGRKNNCTFCGVFRRQALDRAALNMKVLKLATGHNADDGAETILMNILRGDLGRLQRGGINFNNNNEEDDELLPRVKPLKYSFEKDIVMYAHFNKLNYFCTECIYSPNAYRMNARSFIKELERIRPRAILDIVRSGEQFKLRANVTEQILSKCAQCGYITSQKYCKACLLLYGLNNDDPTVGIARKSKWLAKLDMETERSKSAKNGEELNLNNTTNLAIENNNCGSTYGCGCKNKFNDF